MRTHAGSELFNYKENPEEYVFVRGERYYVGMTAMSPMYYPLGNKLDVMVEKTGLFENIVDPNQYVQGMGAGYDSMSVYATAAKAGSAEMETASGKKIRITVLDSAWLDPAVNADATVPAEVVSEMADSALGTRYDAQLMAAYVASLNDVSVVSGKRAVVQSWLDLSFSNYQKDAAGNFKLTIDAAPKAKVVTMNEDADPAGEGAPITQKLSPGMLKRMYMQFPLSSILGTSNARRVSVVHTAGDGQTYTYAGDNVLCDEKLLFVNQSNGFGKFTISGTVSSYKEPVYTWTKTDAGYDVNALAVSEEGDPDVSETVSAVFKVIEEAQCFKDGKGVWTAEFTNPLFTTQTRNETIPQIGHHEYGNPVYTWSDDLKTVTARVKCKACGEEVKETVKQHMR